MFFRRRFEDTMEDEMREHLALREADLIARGIDPAEARRRARAEFGSLAASKDECRDAAGLRWFSETAQDLRYAARALRRSPGFAAVAILTLALGIAANTSIFSVLDAVVKKPLPVHDPARLVWFADPSFSYPIYEQVRHRQKFLSGFFGWTVRRMLVGDSGDFTRIDALAVTEDYTVTLGLTAQIGRLLSRDDADRAVVVLSDRYWRRAYNADPGVIGRSLVLDRKVFTIIGVTQPAYYGVSPGLHVDVTIPVRVVATLKSDDRDLLIAPTRAWLHLMGRLAPGVSQEQAAAAARALWPSATLATLPPDQPADRKRMYLERPIDVRDGAAGFSRVRNALGKPLSLLMAMVGVVLLIVCANLANLLLARGAARGRELAIRASIGASRWRIARQLAVEALLLAAIGGVLGAAGAQFGTRALLALFSNRIETVSIDPTPDWRVLAFTAAVSIAAAVLFGMIPALRASRVDPAPALKSGGAATSGAGRQRMARSLIAVEVALSMVLLAGAGVLARSLWNLLHGDLGFEPASVLIARTDALVAGYEGPRLERFHDDVAIRLAALPGVDSVSLASVPPVSNEMGRWTNRVTIDGRIEDANLPTYFAAITPRYFDSIGAPIIAGRDFASADGPSAPPVAIVTTGFALRYFGSGTVLGHRIGVGRGPKLRQLEIVGVVPSIKYQRLDERDTATVYLPAAQSPGRLDASNMIVAIRGRGALAQAVRAEFQAIDRTVPVEIETLASRVESSVARERTLAVLAVAFAITAALLSAIGLYGVLAYTVARRTQEIGVRLALGATPRAVVGLVLRDSALVVGLGLAAGLAASLALASTIEKFVFGVAPADPVSIAAAALVLIAATALAAWLPARRASRLDPLIALRAD